MTSVHPQREEEGELHAVESLRSHEVSPRSDPADEPLQPMPRPDAPGVRKRVRRERELGEEESQERRRVRRGGES